jgi:hypothetical protein
MIRRVVRGDVRLDPVVDPFDAQDGYDELEPLASYTPAFEAGRFGDTDKGAGLGTGARETLAKGLNPDASQLLDLVRKAQSICGRAK